MTDDHSYLGPEPGRERFTQPRFVTLLSRVTFALAVVATIVGVYAVNQSVEATDRAQTAADSAGRVSRVNCERARAFGPSLADFYERENAMSDRLLDEYRRTIPARCP